MSCAGFNKRPFASVSLDTTRVMSYSTICGKVGEIVTPGNELSGLLLLHWAPTCCWEIKQRVARRRPTEIARINIHTSQINTFGGHYWEAFGGFPFLKAFRRIKLK